MIANGNGTLGVIQESDEQSINYIDITNNFVKLICGQILT
ncbi:MAG: hypothetical protein FD123_417 [Bacteroidetes bacterium]|nr:MAG: hypothetical protein FD123_417 [Bacteroidota bacterium]